MLQTNEPSTPQHSPSTHTDRRDAPPSATASSALTGDGATKSITDDGLRALKNRDSAAVEQWIYGHRELLFHVLLKLVKDRELARELLQETFFQALRSIASFRGDSKVSTWLVSIARNVAFTHFRNQDRYTTAESETLEYLNFTAADASSVSVRSDPRAHTEQSERKQIIHAALDELPDSYREVIQMRDLQERSTQEVAETLNLTRVNVRVRLHRARKQLKRLLAPKLSAEFGVAM